MCHLRIKEALACSLNRPVYMHYMRSLYYYRYICTFFLLHRTPWLVLFFGAARTGVYALSVAITCWRYGRRRRRKKRYRVHCRTLSAYDDDLQRRVVMIIISLRCMYLGIKWYRPVN